MFFDGKASSGRQVNLSGKKGKTDTKDLIENARKQREQREILKQKNKAVTVIQSRVRRYLVQRKLVTSAIVDFDKKIEDISKIGRVFKMQGGKFRVPINTLSSLLSYLNRICRKEVDIKRLSATHELFLESLSEVDEFNYLRNCSHKVFQDLLTYRFLKLIDFSFSSLLLLDDNSIEYGKMLAFLQKVFFDGQFKDYSFDFGLSSVDDLLHSLRLLILKKTSTNTSTSFLLTILKSLLTSPQLNSDIEEKILQLFFFHLFTIPNVFQSPEINDFCKSILGIPLDSKKIMSNLLNGNMTKFKRTFENNEKLALLSNLSMLLLQKKKQISTSPSTDIGSKNESTLFQSDWFTLIEDILFNFQSSMNPNSSLKDSGTDHFTFPFASALRYFEHGNLLSGSMSTEGSEKMDIEGSEPHSISDPQFHMSLSETTVTELISDYILLDGGKKLELHQSFLIHSIQSLEGYLYAQRSQKNLAALPALIESILPILEIFTNADFITAMIDSIYPVNVLETNREFYQNLFSMMRIYSLLLSSCSIDLVDSLEVHNLSSLASRYSKVKFSLLNTLAFTKKEYSLVLRLWSILNGPLQLLIQKFVNLDETGFMNDTDIKSISEILSISPNTLHHSLYAMIYLFSQTLLHKLSAVDDDELFPSSSSSSSSLSSTKGTGATVAVSPIFPVNELQGLVILLKQLMWKFYWNEPLLDTSITTTFMYPRKASLRYDTLLKYASLSALTSLFNHLCIRNERRSFLNLNDFQWMPLQSGDFALVDPNSEVYSLRERLRYPTSSINNTSQIDHQYELAAEGDFFIRNGNVKMILFFIPQVVPFKQRVALFQSLVELDKTNYFNSLGSASNPFAMALGRYNLRANIRRDHLVEDAVKELNTIPGYQLKGKIQIEFTSEQGYQEAGIDGGGLFKEFMDSFAKAIFDPAFGLFIATSNQMLAINPGSNIALGEGYLTLFYFVGKMLGKALYEKLLFQSEFSPGFLNLLLGRINELDDLYHYDEQVYRSLMDLKRRVSQGEDISSFDLYFEVTRHIYDQVFTYELIPNGSQTKVTNQNVLQYIHRYAHYQQNTAISTMGKAIVRGFRELIPIPWIRMFNTKELQLLINGETRKIDLNDLKIHTNYSSGYHESQPYIQGFWQIIDEMSLEDQKAFLKFVTSCVRQPLLGFKELHPTFCIQKVSQYANIPLGSDHEQNPQTIGAVPRLPSAATCMNLLKLPQYQSITILKEKLLYAIRSNSGFELS